MGFRHFRRSFAFGESISVGQARHSSDRHCLDGRRHPQCRVGILLVDLGGLRENMEPKLISPKPDSNTDTIKVEII